MRLCKFLLIIACVLTAYLLLYCVVKDKCTTIERWSFTGLQPGPNILLVGATHGNEPAGGEALKELVKLFANKQLQLLRGTVTVVPVLNPCGLKLGIRYQPHNLMLGGLHADLNRNYPKRPGEAAQCAVSKEIADEAVKHDLVIDLHEGWGFQAIDKESMGSGLYPGKSELAKRLSSQLVNDINSVIMPILPSQSTDPSKVQLMTQDDFKFASKPEWPDVKGSLRWHCDTNNKHYILIETTGQNDIVPLHIRKDQALFLVMRALKHLRMISN